MARVQIWVADGHGESIRTCSSPSSSSQAHPSPPFSFLCVDRADRPPEASDSPPQSPSSRSTTPTSSRSHVPGLVSCASSSTPTLHLSFPSRVTCKSVCHHRHQRLHRTPCSTDESALTRALSQATDTFGPVLDGLILNAGTFEPSTRIGDPSVPLDEWKHHFDVNFFSLVSALKIALPALRTSPNTGRVIFISSGAATGNMPGWAPYNAGKAAMNSLARYLISQPGRPSFDRPLDRTLAKEELALVSLAIAPGKVDTAVRFPDSSSSPALTLPTDAGSRQDYRRSLHGRIRSQGIP